MINKLSDLEHKIQFKDFKLNSLLEITNSINSNHSVAELGRIYEYILHEQLGFKKFLLFQKRKDWHCFLKVGIKGRVKDIDVRQDLMRFKDITVIESSHKKSINQFDIIVPVFHKGKPLAYLLLGDWWINPYKVKGSLDNLSFVQTLTNIIVVAMENKRMANESIKQERLKKELEVASEMQKLLFPSDLPSNKMIDLSAKYLPRHEIGGDYYDYIQLSEDEFLICIADVSGKGISAAMLMANFQATLRTLFNYKRFDLKFLIEELNKKVIKSANGEKFITFFIAEYNSSSRKMNYVNAGHNYPIMTNGKTAKFLDKGCIGLGMLDEIPRIEPQEIDIPPNTTIVMYTDGIVELENEKEVMFETDNLTKIIHSFYPLSMDDLNTIVFSKLDEWRGEKDYVDDTAILSCRIF